MQKISYIFIFSVVAVLTLGGTAHAQQFTEQELELQRMQDRLNSMEKNMATMQQELYKSKGSKSKSKQQPSEEPIGADDERNRYMNGKIEEMEHSVSTLAAKLDKIIADIDFRIASLEKKINAAAAPEVKPLDAANQNKQPEIAPEVKADIQAEKPTEAEKSAEPKAASNAAAPAKADAAAQYDKAFEFLRLAKYNEAEQAFKNFIANNKGSDLLGNAYYWLGETYYIRENYQQAAVNFLKGYQDYPKGNKAADNLLKLSMSLKSLKKEKEACATLDKMKKEYPGADKDLLAKADAEKKGLKCK